jgi:transposase
MYNMTLISIKVPLPKDGIIIRRVGKYRYVYKVLNTYRNEKGQPTNTRVSIGKADEKSGMLIPNNKYWELYGETFPVSNETELYPNSSSLPAIGFESVHSIGATFLIGRILESLGIAEVLQDTFGLVRASYISTAVAYMACRGNVFERVSDWCEGYTFHEPPLSSPSASSLFASITFAERMGVFRKWVALQPEDEYYAYDVTSFSSYATGISDLEWGFNRDKEKLPQTNLGCYLGQKSRLPVFYVTYPGSIVDKSHLPYMMAYNETLGITTVCFIGDRGFCTTANINFMHASNFLYLIGAEVGHKTVRAAIDAVREGIVSVRNIVKPGVYACSVRGRFYGETSTMHVYYDPNIAELQRQDLYRRVEVQEENLHQLEQLTKKQAKSYHTYFDIELEENDSFTYECNKDKVDAAAMNCGFYCLLTNAKFSSSEALDTYKRKDTIEKGFDDIKNYIGMKRLHTHLSTTTDGKIFCSFIALIAAIEMVNKLSEFMQKKSMSKDALIAELEKIKVVVMSDGRRLVNPLTKTQRTIFEEFGLSQNDIINYINNDINNLVSDN